MKRDQSRFSDDELNHVISNWEQIANENNGTFKLKGNSIDYRSPIYKVITPHSKDHLETVLYQIEVKIPYSNKEIQITSYEKMPPIFKYPFAENDFSFSICDEDFFDKIGKKIFGSSEIEIGKQSFDDAFLIETNNKGKLIEFLDLEIREWLETTKIAYFDLNSEKSKNMLSLFFVFDEFSIDNIRKQIDRFKYVISKLKTIDPFD